VTYTCFRQSILKEIELDLPSISVDIIDWWHAETHIILHR